MDYNFSVLIVLFCAFIRASHAQGGSVFKTIIENGTGIFPSFYLYFIVIQFNFTTFLSYVHLLCNTTKHMDNNLYRILPKIHLTRIYNLLSFTG